MSACRVAGSRWNSLFQALTFLACLAKAPLPFRFRHFLETGFAGLASGRVRRELLDGVCFAGQSSLLLDAVFGLARVLSAQTQFGIRGRTDSANLDLRLERIQGLSGDHVHALEIVCVRLVDEPAVACQLAGVRLFWMFLRDWSQTGLGLGLNTGFGVRLGRLFVYLWPGLFYRTIRLVRLLVARS